MCATTHMHMSECPCVFLCVCACVRTCVRVYLCVYICKKVCVCVRETGEGRVEGGKKVSRQLWVRTLLRSFPRALLLTLLGVSHLVLKHCT